MSDSEKGRITIRRVGCRVTLIVDDRVTVKECISETEARALYAKYDAMIRAAE